MFLVFTISKGGIKKEPFKRVLIVVVVVSQIV